MERKISTANHVSPLVVALILTALFLLLNGKLRAQNVAINTDGSKANPNAILDIKSTTKGLLIPRMTTAQRMKIPQTNGLMVYDMNTKSFWYSDGESWENMAAAAVSNDAWLITGNVGTVDNTNFVGTIDNVPLNFRVNNQKAGRIDPMLNNTSIGYRSVFFDIIGHDNTAFGASTLFHLTDGSNNTAVGSNALQANNTGFSNTAIGRMALLANTSGTSNTATGISALSGNSTGSYNTVMGADALIGGAANYNTAMGVYSHWCCGPGNENTSIGFRSLFYNLGNGNTAVGTDALFRNYLGMYNTAVGYQSAGKQDANYVTAIGSYALANGDNSTALGNGAIANGSNTVRIGNAAVTVIEGQVPFTTPSDGRFKFNVAEDVKGLDFILQLRPVTYQFDVKRFDNELNSQKNENASNRILIQAAYNEALQMRRSGFIAQEVELAATKSGYNFSGIIKPKTELEHYGLSYEAFVVPLVKGMQEQQKQIELQKQENDLQNKKIADQDKKIQLLLQELEQLKKKIGQ